MEKLFLKKLWSGKMDINPKDFKLPNQRNLQNYLHTLKLSKEDLLREFNFRKNRKNDSLIVLDLMCGAGNAVKDLNQIEGVSAYGIDINSYTSWKDSPNNFIQADVENLDFIKKGSVDYIFNIIGFFDYCNNWKKALNESLNILASGGNAFYFPFYKEYISQLSLIDKLIKYDVKIFGGNIYDGMLMNRSLKIKRK